MPRVSNLGETLVASYKQECDGTINILSSDQFESKTRRSSLRQGFCTIKVTSTIFLHRLLLLTIISTVTYIRCNFFSNETEKSIQFEIENKASFANEGTNQECPTCHFALLTYIKRHQKEERMFADMFLWQ